MADLTTTAAVKAFAGVTGSGDDSVIDGIVSAVSALIHGEVGHDYEATAVTGENHSAPVSGAIVLRKPAASITEVREDATTLAATGYELSGSRLLYRLASGATTSWSAGTRSIEVDYTAASTVPVDLELAARMACAFVVKQSALTAGAARLGLGAQANADTGSADYFVHQIRDLPFVRATLKRHRALV